MPLYRVKERSFIGGAIVGVGATVEYGGSPGDNLEPLDDDGKAAVAERATQKATRATQKAERSKLPPKLPLKVERKELIAIPADWRALAPAARVTLARQLGAPVKDTKVEQADKMIETEIANRAIV